MLDDNDYADLYDEEEPIEAYCVRCRESILVEAPQAVWTRRGLPATKGECPICGGTVYRMGRTDAHSGERPEAVQVAGYTRMKLLRETVYIAFSEIDTPAAEQLAIDLQKSGLAVWLHETTSEDVAWAGGVHPALQECARLLFLLSPESLLDPSVEATWRYFKAQGKRIVIAQVAGAPTPPDPIRRSPRFDFVTGDYKPTLRQMVGALSG